MPQPVFPACFSCFSLSNGFGQNLLFKLMLNLVNCRHLATISLTDLSSKSDYTIYLYFINYKQQTIE